VDLVRTEVVLPAGLAQRRKQDDQLTVVDAP
jgi:hypothetical protein